METIRTYLNSMFAAYPDTEEIRRAKQELYSMMEDKYSEMIAEGKSENEAIGAVISEFGNPDELAEILGTARAEVEVIPSGVRLISQEEVDGFVYDSLRRSVMIGIGVMCCICSVAGPILFSPIADFFASPGIEGLGVGLMFVLIAVGVGLFILSSSQLKDWKFIDKESCMLDRDTIEYITREKNESQPLRSGALTFGIMMCIVSVVPVIVLSMTFGERLTFLSEGVGPSMLFICTGVGVLFIIISGAKTAALEKLMSLGNL
jgi:hypothetical protein